MVFEHSLLAFKQDIEHRGLLDWLEAHTSFMRPLHRYYGILEINHANLLFSGKDEKTGSSYDLVVKISEITGIHLGMMILLRELKIALWVFFILFLYE
jgi:hypothetical protein